MQLDVYNAHTVTIPFCLTQNYLVFDEFLRIIIADWLGLTALMASEKNRLKSQKRALDTFFQKRGRGRPWKIRAAEVVGRADNYRGILESVWERIWPGFSEANSEDDIVAALKNAVPYDTEFTPSALLILAVLKERGFPKRQWARINFLADSIAARGVVTPRRSRDICASERARVKRAHHVVRWEFYIECSCGYKGPSKEHGCPKCETKIEFPIHLGSNVF
jgi:hypothetical protein